MILASKSQAVSQNEKIAKLKERLNKRGVGEKARWEIQLLDGRKIKWYTSEIGEDEAILVDWKTKESFQIRFSEIKSLKSKSALSTPAKIAIAAAVGAGLLVAIGFIVLAASEGD